MKMTVERKQAMEVNTRKDIEIDEELDILRAAKENSVSHWAMFLVCFKHALRSAEVAELRWSDINWSSGLVVVQRKKGGMRTEQALTRMKGEPLLDEIGALKALRAEQPKELGNDFVFTTRKSLGHIRRETVSRLFNRYVELASAARVARGERPITHSTVHSLRHTRATIMVNTRGVDVWDVKALLGHADISSTLRYTRHNQRKAFAEAERSLVEAMA